PPPPPRAGEQNPDPDSTSASASSCTVVVVVALAAVLFVVLSPFRSVSALPTSSSALRGRVMATLSRRQSSRKPRVAEGLARTVLKTITCATHYPDGMSTRPQSKPSTTANTNARGWTWAQTIG
ncbi:hypothetical protein Vretimale_9530, partial [Volvox reticuliferus]